VNTITQRILVPAFRITIKKADILILKYDENRSVENLVVKRGDIYYADLSPIIGSEQGGVRPVLIIQNDVGNRHSPTIICAAITSRMNKAKLPTHIEISSGRYHLVKDSVILLEQIRTIDKQRLREYVCHVDSRMMGKVNHAIQISLGLDT
jgi:mRNA interferase MazF